MFSGIHPETWERLSQRWGVSSGYAVVWYFVRGAETSDLAAEAGAVGAGRERRDEGWLYQANV